MVSKRMPDPTRISPSRIINVSSVHHLSPFRFPGGKTWLVPRIRLWLSSRPTVPVEFIEPFAGGAIVGLTVAQEKLAEHVTLVDIDEEIAAVWRVIINGEGDVKVLIRRILGFKLSNRAVNLELRRQPTTLEEKAFQTILRNRTNRGGILAPGAGALKHGENGKGILSRWYPETLKKRILNIASIKERIRFFRGDGFEIIRKNARYANAVFFLDPPYTASTKKAGTRLYKYHQVDHEELFRLASKIKGDFLMTYDDAEEVRALAVKHRFETRLVAMSNTHHATMNELLIGRNLDWVR